MSVINGQSDLEKVGIQDRHETINRNDYQDADEYKSTHKDAISDGDPQGKGTNTGGHSMSIPDFTKSPTRMSSTLNPGDGGGSYDINGGPGALNGTSGRDYLKNLNTYHEGEGSEYKKGHKNAISDGDVQGKGTNAPEYVHTTPSDYNELTKNRFSPQLDTNNGGGKFDIEGRPDIEHSGRNRLTAINKYSKGNAYYEDIKIDTSANVMDGQWKQGIKI